VGFVLLKIRGVLSGLLNSCQSTWATENKWLCTKEIDYLRAAP